MALFVGALPLSLIAQIRRPDPAPANPRTAAVGTSKHRTELVIGGGIVSLNKLNATAASTPVGSFGFRRQMSPEWLSLGGTLDVGSTTVDGAFFPYEKRSLGDSSQFVQVDGRATLFAARFNAEAFFPLDEAEKFRAGIGANAGMYAVMPSPAGGAKAGTFVAPTIGGAFIGEAALSPRLGLFANLGFTQFLSFDRDKLRPSDSALEDPVFVTPLITPEPPKKSFGGTRLLLGITYRLGVKKMPARKK
jgi:hypothetical protein